MREYEIAADLHDSVVQQVFAIKMRAEALRLGRPVTRMVLDYVVAGTQVVTERPPEVLRRRALQWAEWHNGRSGRTARQFVDEFEAGLATRRRA